MREFDFTVQLFYTVFTMNQRQLITLFCIIALIIAVVFLFQHQVLWGIIFTVIGFGLLIVARTRKR